MNCSRPSGVTNAGDKGRYGLYYIQTGRGFLLVKKERIT